MALALTNEFHHFYVQGREELSDNQVATQILTALATHPWMSSGLSSNNAFTTALVLRAFGFLKHYKLFTGAAPKKRWHLELNLNNETLRTNLLRPLKEQSNKTALFLYRSLSDLTRARLQAFLTNVDGSVVPQDLIDGLTSDLRRIVHSGFIYNPTYFPDATEGTRNELEKNPLSYKLAELNHQLLFEAFPEVINSPETLSFADIANRMARDENNFRINNYPPAVPVMYWFVDGISRGDIELEENLWGTLCRFASKELDHQRSLVLAEHSAMMDPVTMGMAACLCARLSTIVRDKNKNKDMSMDTSSSMPSMVELVHTIKEVFKHQTKSGIWPKYFPMFHYQEAGSNFCFTFELLEAILHEFADAPDSIAISNELLNDIDIIDKFEKAVSWCEQNRLETFYHRVPYKGWNSGGELRSLTRSQPESWATAVVYMFLWELKSVLSNHIQRRVLEKYKAAPPKPRTTKKENFSGQIDIQLSIKDQPSLLRLLEDELVQVNGKKSEGDVRRESLKQPRSALLFGPPGTSKTRLTAALADALDWPLIAINPSDFVKKGGYENVYLQADEIFRDLDDLAGVVVFFDEMDPLMQSREGTEGKGGLDTPTQFLITSMLPQITKLHDKAQVVFLMATNYKSRFDPALLRSGRFDLLLCMGPPTLAEKIKQLSMFFQPEKLDSGQESKAKTAISAYAKGDAWIDSQLELLTVLEFKEFVKSCGSGIDIGNKLREMKRQLFKRKLREFSKDVTLRMEQLPSKLQKLCPKWDKIPSAQLSKSKTLLRSEIGKYLLDRKQSKKQYSK